MYRRDVAPYIKIHQPFKTSSIKLYYIYSTLRHWKTMKQTVQEELKHPSKNDDDDLYFKRFSIQMVIFVISKMGSEQTIYYSSNGGLMLIQMGKWEKSIFISFPLYDLNWNDTKKREKKWNFRIKIRVKLFVGKRAPMEILKLLIMRRKQG